MAQRFPWKPLESFGSDDPMESSKSANPRVLANNGGSSSIKFALFEAGDSLRRILGA
jgi:hypothetical protein